MKKKQKEALRGKKNTELSDFIVKTRTDIAHAQLKRADEKNTNVVKNLKHELAFALTILNERNQENNDMQVLNSKK